MKRTDNKLQRLIGKKLREHRNARGLTQAKLAKKIGVPTTSISRYENAKVPFALTQYVAICRALKTDPAELMRDAMKKIWRT